MQSHTLNIKPNLFEDYYRDKKKKKKSDMIAFMKANTSYSLKDAFKETTAEVHVYFGEKETGEILRSAQVISKMRPSCTLHRMPNLKHGEFSINHANQYAAAIRQMIGTS